MKKSVLILLSVLVLSSCNSNKPQTFSAGDRALERKVDSVLSLMTLEEKIGQMNQLNSGADATGPVLGNANELEALKQGQVGSLLNLKGAEKTREAQELVMTHSRLKIPLLFGMDVIHGYRTIFPIPLAEAASWDLEMIENSARYAAVEATANGINWTFAPMVDIARDPRWGRIMEGAGEDTYLGSRVAEARVKGFQGADLSDETSMLACVKHFAAYGLSKAGRDYNSVDLSERELREVYLPPFEAAVNSGVGSLMNAFNVIAGVPSTGNVHLQRDILKGEWNFQGFVLSDWGSIAEMVVHGTAADDEEAALSAIMAGSDMDMVSNAYVLYLKGLVESGQVPESYIDDAVRRILRMKFKLGLFDNPYKNCDPSRAAEDVLNPVHLEHARKMAQRSIVLLKNEGNILPLEKQGLSIAVIGPLADSKEDLIATWSAVGVGEECVSLLEGMQHNIGMKNTLLYSKGCDTNNDDKSGFQAAIAAAKKADVIIAAVGEAGNMSGEARSRAYIDIPGVQLELLKELKKLGKPIVTVLMNGRPLAIPWVAENTDAILETWLLGTEGGNAISDVIFGDYNPSGKLTTTFPVTLGQVPINYNHRNTGRPETEAFYTSKYIDVQNEPLFPFGYGLSYTSFEYSELTLESKELEANGSLDLSLEIRNTGDRFGEEVVQLYIRDLVASVSRPVKELKAFQKISLEAGETKTVHFTLSEQDLKFWDINMDYLAEAGSFKVFVGGNSVDVKEAEFILN